MTTKVKALDRLIDAIAGSDVPVAAQTVAGTIDTLADTLAGDDVTFTAQDIAGRLDELAGMIEDGTISIGGGGGDNWQPIKDGNTHFWVESFGADDEIKLAFGISNPGSKPFADFSVDWGDGTIDHPVDGNSHIYSHVYGKAGVFVVTLSCANENTYFTGSSGIATGRAAHNRLLYAELVLDSFNYRTSNILIDNYRLHGVSLSGGQNVGNYLCENCYGLGKLILDDADSWQIGSYSFHNSTLEYIDLPAGVTSIAQYAFDASEPYSVTVRATTPPTLSNANAFSINQIMHIYVPAESVDAYKAASGWSTYASKIQAIPA